jgi:hypothetical protein
MVATTGALPAIPDYMLDPDAAIKDAVRRVAKHPTTPTLVESGNRAKIPGEPSLSHYKSEHGRSAR